MEVITYRVELEKLITQLRGDSDDCSRLEKQIDALALELKKVGQELSEKRQAAAKKIKPLVEAELKELGMAEAEFEVEVIIQSPESRVRSLDEADADDEADESAAARLRTPDSGLWTSSPSGFDDVEMLVRTNPGQPVRPLRKIASGGELSRIMLALKAILAHSDRISVLVFDEIDSNIGGRMGTVIGRKLRELAGGVTGASGVTGVSTKGKRKKSEAASGLEQGSSATDGKHQILCITHLPQIAAFADRHMRIAKSVAGTGDAKQTRTTVTRLEGKERIEELAEMLAGKEVTPSTRKTVEEMLMTAG